MQALKSGFLNRSVFPTRGSDVEKGKTPLGERVTLRWKEMPLIAATVACILGVALSIIWGYSSYAIIFGAGTAGSMFAFYQARINFGLEGVRNQLKGTATKLNETKEDYKVLNSEHDVLNKSFRETKIELDTTVEKLAETEGKLRAREEEFGRLNSTFSSRLVELGIPVGSLQGLSEKFEHLIQNDQEFRLQTSERYVELGRLTGRLEVAQTQLDASTERAERQTTNLEIHTSNLERVGILFAGKMMDILREMHVVNGENEIQVKKATEDFGRNAAQIYVQDPALSEVKVH